MHVMIYVIVNQFTTMGLILNPSDPWPHALPDHTAGE